MASQDVYAGTAADEIFHHLRRHGLRIRTHVFGRDTVVSRQRKHNRLEPRREQPSR